MDSCGPSGFQIGRPGPFAPHDVVVDLGTSKHRPGGKGVSPRQGGLQLV